MTPEELREKVADAMSSAAISFDPNAECVGAAISVCMEAAAGIIRDHADSWRADGDKAIGEQGNGSHGIWCLDVARDFELAGTKIRSLVPEKETT